MKVFWFRVLCGVFWTASVFAPGFSGSIIAITMGIYPDLIRIAAHPFRDVKENLKFMAPLLLGGLISAVLFVLLMNFLLIEFGATTYMLFVGLIAGNLTTFWGDLKKNGFKRSYLFSALAAVAVTLAIGSVGVVFSSSGDSIWSLVVGGFGGGVASLVPGVSVSMIMIMLGAYDQLIFLANSLIHADFSMLLTAGMFLASFMAGMIATSNVIKYAFEKHEGATNAVVFGFLAGSLIGILWACIADSTAGFDWVEGGFMCGIGICVSLLLVEMGKKIRT